ncbi:MAG: hypothetical protein K2L51_05980, partial [Clostridiales bacterium]|nr:hypothetical protein [Clostridiales bacterium]
EYVYGTFRFSLARESVLEIDNGAVENTVFCNGEPIGLTDYTAGIRFADERLHRYIVVPAGEIAVEGYAGHTYYGTMPRDKKQTFNFNGYMPERTYGGIYRIEWDEPLKTLLFLLGFLNSCYRAHADPYYHAQVARAYDMLFDILPLTRKPTADETEKGIAVIEAFLASQTGGDEPYIGAIGHSHLDTAWLWPIAETERKAVRTASNAVRLLEKYPAYRFVMSSMLHYDWFKQKHPALYRKVQALVKSGRFEITAGWVECDCNLAGGEALCRQFARGARFQQNEFGKIADVYWLPDTFGYSAALPQILRLSGVRYFLTTKLGWNDVNKFPYDTFWWAGLDGSKVKVHFNVTHTRLNPAVAAERAAAVAGKRYAPASLVAYGFGDGGGGPSEEMVREAFLCEKYPRAKVEHTSVRAFMERLPDALPVWHGELYLELHRGTLTSQHDLKKYNRLLENLLHVAEFAGAVTGKGKEITDAAYDVLLRNQFHDILPGTCIARVNDEAKAEMQEALRTVGDCLTQTLGSGDLPLNVLSFPVEGFVLRREHIKDNASYTGADGNEVTPVYVQMPAFATGRALPAPDAPRYENGTVTTPFYTARLGEHGIESLVYEGRELCRGSLGKMTVGEDLPLRWDNWDIDADQIRKRRPLEKTGETHFTCGGVLVVRSFYRVSDKTALTRDIVFNSADCLIRFDTATDWQDDHALLTVEFETDLFAPQVRSEVQFGFIDRSVYESTSAEQAAFERVNHRWSELTEGDLSFTVLNDGKYGMHCRENVLGLSLLKSGTHPDERGERGVKTFSYAIYPHTASAVHSVQAAAAFNMPVPFVRERIVAPFTLVSPSVVCETVKTGENGGITLRLYECARCRCDCRIAFAEPHAFYESDIPELQITPLGKGKELFLSFRPFEIKTIVVR